MAMPERHSFDPIDVTLHDGHSQQVADVEEALRVLTEDWPEERGPRHRDAVETCLKVQDGHRSAVEARAAFAEAAAEAGLPAG